MPEAQSETLNEFIQPSVGIGRKEGRKEGRKCLELPTQGEAAKSPFVGHCTPLTRSCWLLVFLGHDLWRDMGSCHGASSPGPGFCDPPQAIRYFRMLAWHLRRTVPPRPRRWWHHVYNLGMQNVHEPVRSRGSGDFRGNPEGCVIGPKPRCGR